MVTKGKNINGLMRHIRNCHEVEIKNSTQKKSLLNMGYYHGYKRFKFIKNKENQQPLKYFSEIQEMHKFDLELKKLFYPMLIEVETGLKNRVIDCLVTDDNPDIEDIYKKKLIDYKDNQKESSKDKLKMRLKLREVIDQIIGYNYGKNAALTHYLHKSEPIPVWFFFEVISFGQFGHFISRLSQEWRFTICRANGIKDNPINVDGRLLEHMVLTLTDLRNATMHNSPVFDANFNKDGVPKQLKTFIKAEFELVDKINFDKIIDYLILLIYILKVQGHSKRELKGYVREFVRIKEQLNTSVPLKTYGELLGVNSNKIVSQIYKYISK